MKSRLLLAVAGAAILAGSAAARADESAELRALKAQAASLQKENQKLEQRLSRLEHSAPAAAPGGADPASFLASAAAKGPGDLLTGEAPLTFYGITLYGSLDAGLGWQSAGSGFNGSSPQSVSQFIGKASNKPYFGGIQGGGQGGYNSIGLKGEQALGVGDLKGVFNLSTNFSPLSGQLLDGPKTLQQNSGVPVFNQNTNGDSSRAGQAFNNLAYVGLSSKTYGELTVGRQSSLTSGVVSGFDPFASSLAFSATGYSGSWTGGGYTETSKWDDSLKYTYNYNVLFVSGLVKFSQWGHPQSGGDGNWNVAAGVKDWNGVSATIAGGHLSGAPKLAALGVGALPTVYPAGTLSGTLADQDIINAGASYKYQQFTVLGGYQFFRLTNPSTTQGTISGTSLWTDGNGYQVSSLTTTAYGSPSNNSIFWAGVRYAYDPKLEIVAGYYHWLQNQYNSYSATVPGGLVPTTCNSARIAYSVTKASSTTAGGLLTTTSPRAANCSGASDAASLAAFYKFTKRLTGYAGLMWSGVSGGLASGYQVTSVWAPSIGIRYNF